MYMNEIRTSNAFLLKHMYLYIYMAILDQPFKVTVGLYAGSLGATAACSGKVTVGLKTAVGTAGLSATAGLAGEGDAGGETGAGGATGLSTTAGLAGTAALDGTAGAGGAGGGATGVDNAGWEDGLGIALDAAVGLGGGGATGLNVVGVEGPAKALEAALTASVIIVELAEAPG
jgi:hypothetical protein